MFSPFSARIKYIVIEQEMYCLNMQIQSRHFLKHFQFHKKENWQLILLCANIHLSSLVHHVFKHCFPEIHEVRTLTERRVITFRKQLINLLYQPTWVIMVKLCEINMTRLISLNKIQRFITG
jgi:hypothetical protein